MKSFVLSLILFFTLSLSHGWTAAPTYEKEFEGNGVVFVEKQVEGFVHLDGRAVYSEEDELLMVEILKISFFSMPRSSSLDPSLQPPELIQCFPEDRFIGKLFIRETSCNNGYGTTWCCGTKCVGYFIYTDDEGLPTGRTSLKIGKIDTENGKFRVVLSEQLGGQELFSILGIVEEKQ